jgi:hypothetical protein
MAKGEPARKVSLVLLDEKPISWNLLYAGKMTWRQRNEEAARVHLAVRCALDPDWPMFTVPVEIEIRVFFKNKAVQLDWANVPAKIYEDGLIGWLIKDDSPKYVRGGRVLSLLDRDNPRVEIDIFEI